MLRTTRWYGLHGMDADSYAPVVLEAKVVPVSSGAPGRAESYVQLGFRISGERAEPITGAPYLYVARLQIDVAKQLYRQLGEAIEHAVAGD